MSNLTPERQEILRKAELVAQFEYTPIWVAIKLNILICIARIFVYINTEHKSHA